jgi:hypothetical protein
MAGNPARPSYLRVSRVRVIRGTLHFQPGQVCPDLQLPAASGFSELSRPLLNLAERDGRASYPSVHGAEEDTDIAAPLEKIDPEPIVALAFSPTVAAMTHAARSAAFAAPRAVMSTPSS